MTIKRLLQLGSWCWIYTGAQARNIFKDNNNVCPNDSDFFVQLGDDINGNTAKDLFGTSVALSSDGLTLAVGATDHDGNGSNSGRVEILEYVAGSWSLVGSAIIGEAANDRAGISVSLSSDGRTVAIGAYKNDGSTGSDSGHVQVYSRVGNAWNQLGNDVDGEDVSDRSGVDVDLSADGLTVAIGAKGNNGNGGNDSGHVRVYRYGSGSWTLMGNDIDGEAAGDESGGSVSLSADGLTVAIGANKNDGNGANAGHVRVYGYDGIAWTKIGDDVDGEAAEDNSGAKVVLSSDGSTVAIGAYANNGNGNMSGHVRVYKLENGAWTLMGSDLDGESGGDESGFGLDLSADGLTVAIGAYYNDGINGADSGHVRVYNYDGSDWILYGTDIDGEAATDYFGVAVALSSDGSTVAIGAYGNDDNGSEAGHVRVMSVCESTGRPSMVPSGLPSHRPSARPSDSSSILPTNKPSQVPSLLPSDTPSVTPSLRPSITPSILPTNKPSQVPSVSPSEIPSATPSLRPSSTPSILPTNKPSQVPSVSPSEIPSATPSLRPSITPSILPTSKPSQVPSVSPSEILSVTPSLRPSSTPSVLPTSKPSQVPSVSPSEIPSILPTSKPSQVPSLSPSRVPSAPPSLRPSDAPSLVPTGKPSQVPSLSPSKFPSVTPSLRPSYVPSVAPTNLPSKVPSLSPSKVRSSQPTNGPSDTPSRIPTDTPSISAIPSTVPTDDPTNFPTRSPTKYPTPSPTKSPTNFPTKSPTNHPTRFPTESPTKYPTRSPTVPPTKNPTDSPTQRPTRSPNSLAKITACVAIMDESFERSDAQVAENWGKFRNEFPDRPFCLLQPFYFVDGLDEDQFLEDYPEGLTEESDALRVPDSFLNDKRTSFHKVYRDRGKVEYRDDWYDLCDMEDLVDRGIEQVAFFVDQSGSMDLETVRASYDWFLETLDRNDVEVVYGVLNDKEDWIRPFYSYFMNPVYQDDLISDEDWCKNARDFLVDTLFRGPLSKLLNVAP